MSNLFQRFSRFHFIPDSYKETSSSTPHINIKLSGLRLSRASDYYLTMGLGNRYALRVLLPLLVMVGACTLLQSTDCMSPSSFLGRARRRSLLRTRKSLVNKDGLDLSTAEYETHYYTQILDHFTYRPEGYHTFQQRYLVNAKHWGGPQSHSPIFVYMGDESSIVEDFDFTGFIIENAPQFQALVVYIEVTFIYFRLIDWGSMELLSFKLRYSINVSNFVSAPILWIVDALWESRRILQQCLYTRLFHFHTGTG
jgi:hypothetical protein